MGAVWEDRWEEHITAASVCDVICCSEKFLAERNNHCSLNTDNNVGKTSQLRAGWTDKTVPLCDRLTCLFISSLQKSNVQKPRVGLYHSHSSLYYSVCH